MTEAEAKTRWCPFARDSETAGNRSAQLPDDIRFPCIASACMAWRWNEPWTSQTEEGHGGDLVVRLKRKPGEAKLGFCGLAGAPQ